MIPSNRAATRPAPAGAPDDVPCLPDDVGLVACDELLAVGPALADDSGAVCLDALAVEELELPDSAPPRMGRVQRAVTAVILFGPLAGVVAAVVMLFGRGIDTLDILLGVGFYAIAGHGVTAGYHRLFAHRGFTAKRGVKIALCVAGSLAFEGAVIGWVANHRRHHAFTDRAGDPHSPHLVGDVPWSRTRGALHAHVGWMLKVQPTDVGRWAPDLAADRDLVVISRLFPLLCLVSLGLPALIGWGVTGTTAGALGAFVWGGLVRVFILQHATFAVNSACHIWGSRPFKTRTHDRATNFAPLALLSMGENWHNLHHSYPRLARHGVDRWQLDSTALLIRVLERIGVISKVRWPTRDEVDARRLPTARPPRPRSYGRARGSVKVP